MSKGKIGFGVALLVFFVVGITGRRTDSGSTPAEAPTPDQGVALDESALAEAEEVWAALINSGVVRRWECEHRVCRVQVNPLAWMSMEYDTRHTFALGLGMAAATIHEASYTHYVDVMTGKDLATYSAQLQRVGFTR